MEHPPPICTQGELRRLPPPLWMRVLQALSLWMFFRGTVDWIFRSLLGVRHFATAVLRDQNLELSTETRLWGRTIRSTRRTLSIKAIEEIALERRGEPFAFSAGLVSLSLGTFVGSRLFFEGLFSGALSLFALGPLLIAVGVALDYFVGSGRSRGTLKDGPAQLLIRARGERGWVLSQVELPGAELLLQALSPGPESPLQSMTPPGQEGPSSPQDESP